LIELMFAVVILTVISLAAFTVINTGQRTAVTNDQTVQIQQNTRVALDLISRDIRMAGYGMNVPNPPNPNQVLGPGSAGCNALINPGNAATGPNTPDQISIVTVDQVIGTGLAFAPAVPGASITIAPATAVAALNFGEVISLDGVFTATVTNPNPVANPVTLSTGFQTPQQFGTATGVVKLQCVTYLVNLATNQLWRNGVPVADGIIDLQLAYGVDAVAPLGQIDDQNGGIAGTMDCLDFIPNVLAQVVPNSVGCPGTGAVGNPPGLFPAPPTTSIRLVRISVVGQALRGDTTFTGGTALTVEDHNIPANPGFRRRVLTRTINLRDIS
jgi:type IV pilus assembly protein PilW